MRGAPEPARILMERPHDIYHTIKKVDAVCSIDDINSVCGAIGLSH